MRSPIVALMAIGFAAAAQAATGTDSDVASAACEIDDAGVMFEVNITGVQNANGQLGVYLYGDVPENFMKKGKWLVREWVPAQEGDMRVCLPAPGPGLYAISLYHDEDSNRRLGQNWIGIPTEGFGFSRDAPAPLRLPHFSEAAVEAHVGVNPTHIRVRY